MIILLKGPTTSCSRTTVISWSTRTIRSSSTTSWSTTDIRPTTWWDTTSKINHLVFKEWTIFWKLRKWVIAKVKQYSWAMCTRNLILIEANCGAFLTLLFKYVLIFNLVGKTEIIAFITILKTSMHDEKIQYF